MELKPTDIRGVLIQVEQARLLLPNATIAEVLSFAEPEQVADAPSWLLGKIRWRGWEMPLLAYSKMIGRTEDETGNRVLVLKALGGNATRPYFGIVVQGFPRLVTVTPANLAEGEEGELPEGVLAQVRLNENDALVPDLAWVETRINEALAA